MTVYHSPGATKGSSKLMEAVSPSPNDDYDADPIAAFKGRGER